MLTQAEQHISPEEYLAGEREAATRHEYFAGEIFAMAGASREHNQISANIVRLLGNQLLERPCSVFASDMKVKIKKKEKYTYPDIVVVCEKEEYEDEHQDVLLNPVVLIEILSDSTEAYDRGDKFSHYQEIPSFAEYILVSQYTFKMERFSRQPNNSWLYTIYQREQDLLSVQAIDCTLPLAEVYRKVQLHGTDR
ncbi:MAG: Uma2 family endonuclease [Candidatus Electrothrix aestuarii]|uniref:Uma2 family endonuclease n=1 Tax=Candidatus Electrothrix aestuarii TaxID=3062594 RepID=A0AAU8LSE3_9BACT|nr:Uma2 family endonuclease [Candidatus Electrothrix aestuarii]